MADIKQILKELKVPESEISKSFDNSYVVDIADMDEFGKYYSALDNNRDVAEMTENSLLTLHGISLNYLYKNYQVSLISDNDQDTYKMVITSLSKKDIEKIERGNEYAQEVEEEEEKEVEEEEKWERL